MVILHSTINDIYNYTTQMCFNKITNPSVSWNEIPNTLKKLKRTKNGYLKLLRHGYWNYRCIAQFLKCKQMLEYLTFCTFNHHHLLCSCCPFYTAVVCVLLLINVFDLKLSIKSLSISGLRTLINKILNFVTSEILLKWP